MGCSGCLGLRAQNYSGNEFGDGRNTVDVSLKHFGGVQRQNCLSTTHQNKMSSSTYAILKFSLRKSEAIYGTKQFTVRHMNGTEEQKESPDSLLEQPATVEYPQWKRKEKKSAQ